MILMYFYNIIIYKISEGYTSISVREPLSRIMANARNGSIPSDPHYAFVSDDSGMGYS